MEIFCKKYAHERGCAWHDHVRYNLAILDTARYRTEKKTRYIVSGCDNVLKIMWAHQSRVSLIFLQCTHTCADQIVFEQTYTRNGATATLRHCFIYLGWLPSCRLGEPNLVSRYSIVLQRCTQVILPIWHSETR
jgi:hypothetical protein